MKALGSISSTEREKKKVRYDLLSFTSDFGFSSETRKITDLNSRNTVYKGSAQTEVKKKADAQLCMCVSYGERALFSLVRTFQTVSGRQYCEQSRIPNETVRYSGKQHILYLWICAISTLQSDISGTKTNHSETPVKDHSKNSVTLWFFGMI